MGNQTAAMRTPSVPLHRPAVELEEVPDIEDEDTSSDSDGADSQFELGGILSNNSEFNSDGDDDED